MSRLVARILLTILMFPLASLVYTMVFAVSIHGFGRWWGYNWGGSDVVFALSGLVAWVFVAIYWSLLWRKSTAWTRKRRLVTLLAALGGVVAAIVVANAVTKATNREFGAFMGTALAPLLWLTATVFIWRETSTERATRLSHLGTEALVCPACGYNLTGLREARCPECGAQHTLNELVANQPARAAGEMERV